MDRLTHPSLVIWPYISDEQKYTSGNKILVVGPALHPPLLIWSQVSHRSRIASGGYNQGSATGISVATRNLRMPLIIWAQISRQASLTGGGYNQGTPLVWYLSIFVSSGLVNFWL